MSKRQSISFYYLLGVSENATSDEIKQAYLNWMQKINASIEGLPDDDKRCENARIMTKVLNEICQVLNDKELRQRYNQSRYQGKEILYGDGTIISYCDKDGLVKGSFDIADFVEKAAEIGDNYGAPIFSSGVPTSQQNGNDTGHYGIEPIVSTSPTTNPNDPTGEPVLDPNNSNPILVTGVDDSDKAKKTAGKGKKVLKGVAIGVIIAAIIAGAVGVGYLLGAKKDKKDDKDEDIHVITPTSVSETITTAETTQVAEPEVASPIVNFGDATDPEVVNKKVDELSDLLNQVGIVDPQTRVPYDKEDLKNIILFMNAAFIPETDEQAYAMVNQQLDLTCQVLSTPRVINFINHTAGISTFTEEMVKDDIKNGTDLCLVDSMLLGDSYGYEYLQYLEDSYNELLKTTNKDEFVRKYTKVVNSLAQVVYGEPFVLNDREYTINDFCGLNNINDGNLLTMYANMLSVLNVDGVNQFVTVKDVDGSDITVSLEELFSNFDLICVSDKLDIDDNGKIVGNVDNFHQRVQVDTINAAIENRYHGNLNAYDYNYNKSLRK